MPEDHEGGSETRSVGKSLMARSLGEAAAQPHSMPSALAYYRFYHPLDSMKIMRHFEQS